MLEAKMIRVLKIMMQQFWFQSKIKTNGHLTITGLLQLFFSDLWEWNETVICHQHFN